MEKIAFGIFFIFCVILFLLFTILKNKRLSVKDNLDCFMLFSAPFFLYSIVGSYGRIGNNSTDIYTFCIFYFSVILGYTAFSIGYINSLGKYDNSYKPVKIRIGLRPEIIKKGCVRKDDLLMLAILLFCIAMNYSEFISMITDFGSGVSYVDTFARSERTALSGPMSLLNSFFLILLPMYPFYRVWRTNKITAFDIFLITIATIYCISSGYRSSLLLIGLSLLALFNYRSGYLKLKFLVPLCVVALLFMVALGHLRARSNITDMITMFRGSGSDFLKLTSSGEFLNPIGTFFNYANAISIGRMSFNYGYTWLVDLGVWIPYFIWPGRPLPWPEQYMLDFFPNALAGTGHGWYVLNDGYMSFGILGVMLELYIIGITLGKAYKYFMDRRDNPMYMVMYIILMLFNFEMVRTGFLSTVKNYFLQILLFAIIIVVSNGFRIIIKRKSYNSGKKRCTGGWSSEKNIE